MFAELLPVVANSSSVSVIPVVISDDGRMTKALQCAGIFAAALDPDVEFTVEKIRYELSMFVNEHNQIPSVRIFYVPRWGAENIDLSPIYAMGFSVEFETLTNGLREPWGRLYQELKKLGYAIPASLEIALTSTPTMKQARL